MDVITSTLGLLKESIESSDINENIFQSSLLSIGRKIIPKVIAKEEKEAITARKRGMIFLRKKEC